MHWGGSVVVAVRHDELDSRVAEAGDEIRTASVGRVGVRVAGRLIFGEGGRRPIRHKIGQHFGVEGSRATRDGTRPRSRPPLSASRSLQQVHTAFHTLPLNEGLVKSWRPDAAMLLR